MALTITQVDAFASQPFEGNPAAVCLLPEPADAAWMQRVAREMNLSETAFLVRRDDGAFDLRWFTPGVEVDLCGHATLASAHVLWESGHLAPDAPAVFHTLSGRLSAVRRDRWIEMDFPAEPDKSVSGPDWLADALGAEPIYVGRNRLDYLVEVAAEATVRRLAPDLRRIAKLGQRGVIVTARADIPRRTNIDAPVPERHNKHVLFGQQEGRCNAYRSEFPFRNFTIDHVIPESRGGTDHIENLQLLCGHCNSVKGDRPQEYLVVRLRELGIAA